MWKHQNRRPRQATAHDGLRSTSSVIRGGSFEQHLAARHMMLHWLAIQKASAAVDTGRQCPRPNEHVKQAAHKAQAHEWKGGKQSSATAAVVVAKLSNLLSRCHPVGMAPATGGRSSAAQLAQSRLAQMPWCYQAPLRHAERTSAETTQNDQPNLKEEDHSSTLDSSTPYLNFLARLTEHLVHQPDLSDEALHGACEKYIATEANGLDQDVLWNLVRELFSELYHSKYPAC
ncbi:uncharacterized protein LOC119163996 isoform X2 [Rhipicephalus microplus]|uniref:uncharacterized protein LOC119163996 isoform X2 n=1 Tax=Rhipicephalus microplus TaxID=6941 RepID=UPI003F6D5824